MIEYQLWACPVWTCPHCRAIVDYSCLCDLPGPTDDWIVHDSVYEAKAHVAKMKAEHDGKTS